MCKECGVELDDLLDNTSMDDMPDLLALLSGMFGEPLPIQDFMEEYRTDADVTLTGDSWKVAVAKQGGTSDLNKVYESGEEWIINVYEDDVLTDSMVVDAVSPKSTQQVANEFAGHLFGYGV